MKSEENALAKTYDRRRASRLDARFALYAQSRPPWELFAGADPTLPRVSRSARYVL